MTHAYHSLLKKLSAFPYAHHRTQEDVAFIIFTIRTVSRVESYGHGRHDTDYYTQYGIVQYTVQYSTVQYSTVQYSTVQYSTAQQSTVQYSTVQYSAVRYSTAQYSTVQ